MAIALLIFLAGCNPKESGDTESDSNNGSTTELEQPSDTVGTASENSSSNGINGSTNPSSPPFQPPPPHVVGPEEQRVLDQLPKSTLSAVESASQIEELPTAGVQLLEEGKAIAQIAAENFENIALTKNLQARFLVDFGEPDSAREIWLQVIEQDSKNITAIEGLQSIAKQQGEFELAVQYSRLAVEAAPSDPNYALELGIALLDAAELEESKKVLASVAERYPMNPEAHVELACVLLQKDELEAAKSHLETALELAPNQRAIHLELGKTYSRLGKREEAKKHFDEHRRLQAEFANQDTLARQEYDDAKQNRIDVAKLITDIARVFLEQRYLKAGEVLLQRAYELDDRNFDCRQLLGILHQQRGEFEQAIAYLKEVAVLFPEQFVVSRDITLLYLQQGKLAEAEKQLVLFSEQNPKNLDAHVAITQFFMTQVRKPDQAIRFAEKVCEIQVSPQAFLLLASAQEFAGNSEQAAKTLDRAIVMDPGNPQYEQMQRMLREQAKNAQP
ncbi:MAG: tetratricopeptide repeat protein [Planctomycetota bacterium]